MIIKLNFYDIYGFALPGFLLIAVFWLPFGFIENKWPDPEFSSALVGIIFAYFAGHVLHTVAHHVLPSTLENGRYPSSKYLDMDDHVFTREFKERLATKIYSVFGLNIYLLPPEPTEQDLKDLESVRRDAFFLCRSALMKSKTIFYAEQFEGLYALMRGLSAVFAVAIAYYLGWAYSGVLRFIRRFLELLLPASSSVKWSGLVVLIGILVALIFGVRVTRVPRNKRNKVIMVASLQVAAFATGYYLGLSHPAVGGHRGEFTALAVFSFFASERCYAGYKALAQDFVKAVYRDFSLYEGRPPQREVADEMLAEEVVE